VLRSGEGRTTAARDAYTFTHCACARRLDDSERCEKNADGAYVIRIARPREGRKIFYSLPSEMNYSNSNRRRRKRFRRPTGSLPGGIGYIREMFYSRNIFICVYACAVLFESYLFALEDYFVCVFIFISQSRV